MIILISLVNIHHLSYNFFPMCREFQTSILLSIYLYSMKIPYSPYFKGR